MRFWPLGRWKKKNSKNSFPSYLSYIGVCCDWKQTWFVGRPMPPSIQQHEQNVSQCCLLETGYVFITNIFIVHYCAGVYMEGGDITFLPHTVPVLWGVSRWTHSPWKTEYLFTTFIALCSMVQWVITSDHEILHYYNGHSDTNSCSWFWFFGKQKLNWWAWRSQ